jgi:hypothetical protein
VAIQFVDRVRVSTATTGTGTITLGMAVPGFRSFALALAAGDLASGAIVYYTIEDSGNAWEVGSGVYTFGAETLTRIVSASSLGGTTALTLTGSASIYLTATANLLPALLTTLTVAALSAPVAIIGSNTSATSALVLDAASATTRAIYWQTTGLNRWAIYATNTAETGGNAGSDLSISNQSDTGTALYTPLTITRSTGLVSVNNGIAIIGTTSTPTAALNDSSTLIASTAYVMGQASTTLPLINGTATSGIGSTFARSDHGHPSDTSRQAVIGFTPVQQGGGTGQTTADKVYMGWNSALTGVKITVNSTDLGNLITTVYPQNYAQSSTSVNFASVNVTSTSVGSILLVPGSASNTGYAAFYNPAGTQQGYAGFGAATGVLNLAVENGTIGWATNLNFACGTTLSVGTDCVVGGNVVSGGATYACGSANAFYLNIDGSGNRVMNYSTSGWKHYWRASDGYYIYANNAGTPLYYCDGSGNFTVTGTVTAANVSDARTKENVQSYTRGLADLIQLKPVSFQYNGLGGTTRDGRVFHGVTAQQAQPFVPECVALTHDPRPDPAKPFTPSRLPGQLSFHAKPLIFASVNAFKEINARLERIEQALIDQHLR